MASRLSILLAPSLLAGVTGLLIAGCGVTAPRPLPGVDCSQADAFEFSMPEDFEGNVTWFGSGDSTDASSYTVGETNAVCTGSGGSGGSNSTAPSVSNPAIVAAAEGADIDGGRCGSARALRLRSSGHSDWGSLFGDYNFNSIKPWDGSGYEGFALWARHEGGDPALTFVVDTWQTSRVGDITDAGDYPICKVDCNAGTGTQSVDATTGNVLSQSYVSPPGTCGNSFQYVLRLTETWQLYLIPFSAFFQELKPNMSPNGMDPAHINGLTFRAAKEANIDVWIDDIAFYRRK